MSTDLYPEDGSPSLSGEATDPLIGREIMGTYKLVQVLGRGGMAVVYRGRHVLTDQIVAIKALPPDLASNSQVKARFIEEARTLARLEHPNIVGLYNFLEENGHLFLVMQYAEGQTFDQLIEEEGRVAPADVVAVGIETLKALSYAHGQGIIHRDIKPSNIIIRDYSSVKVMDFGIAKIVGSTKLTVTGQTMGTVRFMAPEQVRGKNIDHRADLYSLGVTLYQAATGQTPFDGETHFDIMRKHLSELPRPPGELADIPSELGQTLLRVLEKRADARFQSADDFLHALERVPVEFDERKLTRSVPLQSLDDGQADNRRPSVPVDPTRVTRSRQRVGLQVAVAAVLLVLAAAGVLWVMLTDSGGKGPRGDPPKVATGSGKASGSGNKRALRMPPPHRVARGLRLATDKRFERLALRVMIVKKKLEADEIARFYQRARVAYPRFLREEGIDLEVRVGPLNLALVPQRVLNSKRHWRNIKPNIDYPTRYFAAARTLYVRDGKGFMKTDLPYGVALHFCARLAQISNQRCGELAEGFEKYLRAKGPGLLPRRPGGPSAKGPSTKGPSAKGPSTKGPRSEKAK